MPAEKRRKAKTPEAVPDLGDPERKRVLNVLAQRRYRQRRREKIAELEAKANGLTPPQTSEQQNACEGEGGFELGETPTSNSAAFLNSSGDFDIEEITRSATRADFPALGFDQDPLDFALFPDFGFTNLPSPNPTSPGPSPSYHSTSTPASTSLSKQTPKASSSSANFNLSFPLTADGGTFNIPILSALRAFGTIATYLDITAHLYNPFYLHVLPPTPHPLLPPNLHPTPAQITIPHHPVIDTLPWPSVREKLICVFALPSSLRPPIARETLEPGADFSCPRTGRKMSNENGNGNIEGQANGIMQIMHDVDDFSDGIRVHGCGTAWSNGNELLEESWEVGEQFFRNWWWCIDSKILEVTNARRKERGLGVLRLKN